MESERYPTDLKDEEWALIAGLFTKSEKRGKKPNNDMRRIVDGCFYLLRGGIAWRMMPHDLPPWKEVYYYLDKWRKNGKWEVESRTGAVAWAIRHHPVSRPRSSNRTCGFPASGFPTGFI